MLFTKNTFLLTCLISASIFLMPSCSKDDLAREKFLGSYQVNENCATGTYSYSMNIVESSAGKDGIIIQDFGDFQSTINLPATVSGNNISFNYTQDGVTISGNGTITGNTLTIIYQTSGGFTDSCTSTAIKQ